MLARWAFCLILAGMYTSARTDQGDVTPTCPSPIFCQGELLHTVQMARVFKDSKTFVDMGLKYSVKETLYKFTKFMRENGNNPDPEKVKTFVNENFDLGKDLVKTDPLDWSDSPSVLSRISDPKLKDWASKLNELWKNFTRKMSSEIKRNPERYSLIDVPNRFVVPGGRFNEFYYWDTLWIIRGLLLCDMENTVRGMLENFIHMVKTYGHVPNGGRIYYIQRSQPPLFIPMVDAYYEETGDVDFVRKHYDVLEKEYQFWKQNRAVEVQRNNLKYKLARYYAVSLGPRPESYREDYGHAIKGFSQDDQRQEFYVDIKSGAESGWDFSSRWYIVNSTNKGKLTDIRTRYIIPVDLNSFLCMNAQILSKMSADLGYFFKADYFEQEYRQWKEAIHAVHWNEEEGTWLDYDILNHMQRNYFYASNFAPLWTGCYDYEDVGHIANKVVGYLNKHEMSKYHGIPTSELQTGEQWDFPNAWPPLQGLVIQGLAQTQQPIATKLAYEYAERWVLSNYKFFALKSVMAEKYNATGSGIPGSLGEYDSQFGFGWTNGVILELLSTYGHKIKVAN